VSFVHDAERQIIEDDAAPLIFIPFNLSKSGVNQVVVKTGAGYLYGFTAVNANAAARFILLFDASVALANGAVPAASFQVAAANDKEVTWIPPRRMDQGIVLAASTTQLTLTLATAADHLFDVQYI
jgi:hypothetical protein